MVGHGGGHGQVLRVAGSVAADKGQDEEGGSEVENEGYEERDENALYDISGGVAVGRRRVALTLRKCKKAAMVQDLLRRCYLCVAGVCEGLSGSPRGALLVVSRVAER